MKECAGDIAASRACLAERTTLTIDKIDEPFVVSSSRQRGVMELVTAQDRARRTNRTVAEKARLAVAQVQLASGKARCMPE